MLSINQAKQVLCDAVNSGLRQSQSVFNDNSHDTQLTKVKFCVGYDDGEEFIITVRQDSSPNSREGRQVRAIDILD